MTFSAIETSVDSGRPVELVLLNYSQQSWFYTTSDVPIVFGANVYEPLPLTRGEIPSSGDATKVNLKITVPYNSPIGELFRARPPSEVVTVSVFAEHYLDNDFQTIWKGRITSVDWKFPWLELNSENVFSSLRRVGLRRRYGVQCGHVLYGGSCKVDRALFKVSGSVTAISGADVTISTISGTPADYFAGGYAEWVSAISGVTERMMIVGSALGKITLTGFPFGLGTSAAIDVYPGCDHSLSACDVKYGNSLNFGGTPFIPQKNPFAGTAIY